MKRLVSALGIILWALVAGVSWAAETTEIWTETYDSGKDNTFQIPWSGNMTANQDYAVRTAIDSQGNIIVAGYRAGDTAHGYNGYAIKYDRAGNIICSIELDGGAIGSVESSSPGGYSTDSFSALAVDSQDNIILGASKAGNYYLHGYWQEVWLMKYSPTCAAVWAAPVEYHGPPDFYDSAWQNPTDIAVDASDNIYVAGYVFGGWYNGEGHWFVFKYDKNGVPDPTLRLFYDYWDWSYLNEFAYGIAVDSVGDVIVVGRKGVAGCNGCLSNTLAWHVRKYGPTGALLWEDSFTGPNNLYNFSLSVKVDSSDNVVVAGYTNAGTDNSAANTNNNWLVIKYAKDGWEGNGQRFWSASYTFDGAAAKGDYIYNGLAIGKDDHIWIGGSTTDSGGIGHRRFVLLDSATGSELYSKDWTANTNHESLYGLTFRNGALLTTGARYNGTYWDWLTTAISTVQFDDVASDSYFVDYIRSLHFYGVTTGCTQNPLNYCPTNLVNRQQMAAFIIRAVFGEDFPYTPEPFFSDVPSTSLFFKYVQKMKDLGITTGCNPPAYDQFCPTQTVNRQQMAAFIIRALHGESFTFTPDPWFTDVPDTHPFFKYIQKMKDEGITTGIGDGTYRPAGTVNRGAMAAFIARAFLGMP